MAKLSKKVTGSLQAGRSLVSPRRLFHFLAILAMAYALLAGLRTLTDYDLGWQLASGRWLVQHRHVPSTDFFSYTAYGRPWVYPALSGLIFYSAYNLGGYVLLSWLGAITCMAVVAVLLWRSSIVTAMLLILATPLIAARVQPRADMFTVFFFAVYLTILWRQYRFGGAPLWILPPLMVLWVNLHLGFIVGLGAVSIYVIAEAQVLSPPVASRSSKRLPRATFWMALAFVATLVNPWGWGIYQAVLRQNGVLALHDRWITEWAPTPITWETTATAFNLRDTRGAFFVLLAVTALAVINALHRRHFASVILMIASSYLAIQHVRFQALFACMIVTLAGTELQFALESARLGQRVRWALCVILSSAFAVTAGLRSVDLVSNREYLHNTSTAEFGAGPSWWFPEGATRFIERQTVPTQLFNSYNLGGFLLWRLAPGYPDYIDGRAIPFGAELYRRQDELMRLPPDSSEWQREASLRGINSIIVSLARYNGLQFFPLLRQFCDSNSWVPVYLDEVSAVFVRHTGETEELIRRYRVNCSTAPLPATALSNSKADRFNQWANAAAILLVLGRTRDSLTASDNALVIFPQSANVHYIRARDLAAIGRSSQAEDDLLTAVKLEPSEGTWAALAQMYRTKGNRAAAIDAFTRAAHLAPDPHVIYLTLAYTLLEDNQSRAALRAMDDAVRTAPPADAALPSDASFPFSVAHGRSSALASLGDIPKAATYQEEAIRLAPERADLWMELSTLYGRMGKTEAEGQAKQHAKDLTRKALQ